MPKRHNFKTYMEKDGISFQPKMSTNQQIKVRTQVLCKDLRYPDCSGLFLMQHFVRLEM